MTRIAIFGLGLIGGSLALALRRVEPDWVILGIDLAAALESETARRTAHELIDARDRTIVEQRVSGVDLAVLCSPVRAIEESVADVLQLANVVTDCGSTKRAVTTAAAASPRRRRFVPGHPMAGAPESGIQSARADLFEGWSWILCPEGADEDAVQAVERLVRSVGAHPIHMDAVHHDRAVALTSHSLQVLASVLLTAAARHDAFGAAGPAFERATRVAGGPDRMWRDILETNADCLAEALTALGTELSGLGERLRRSPPDLDAILAVLAQARQQRTRD